MPVLDVARHTKGLLTVTAGEVTKRALDNLPELSRPRLLASLLGLALACTKVSTSRAATTACPNEQIRQESDINPATGKPYSTELPDCRAYELVSTDSGGVDAMLPPLITSAHSAEPDFGLVSEDGGRLLWDKEVETYSAPNDGASDVYQATRGSGGWSQSDALVPPGFGSTAGLFLDAASSDLSTLLLLSLPTPEVEVARTEQLIERGADGAYTTIASIPRSVSGEQLVGQLSGDGSHAFFQTPAQLAGDTHTAGRQLYEWTSGGGLHVVGVNDAGEPVSPCGAVLASNASEGLSYPDVSQDGSRVFFQSPDPLASKERGLGFCGRPELYLRESGSTTIEISKAPPGAAECEPDVSECTATFVGATPEGSKVFFVTRTHLTSDKSNSDPDLYEYDVETGALERLSVGPPGYDDADLAVPASAEPEPENFAIVSGDGSHVYFTGLGQLVPGVGASAATNKADGTVNLYMHANSSVSFIATVGPGNFTGIGNSNSGNIFAPLAVQLAEVTPDGSDLVFDSDSRLTAYDNAGQSELYRYDESSATISCVSCSPAFAAPNGPLDPVFHTSFWGEPHGTVQQFGGLSNDGDMVFFASTDELLPAATNVLAAEPFNPIYDIYEWHDGVLSLISSGTSPSSDFLIGASPSGSDVFFMSNSQLIPQDGEHNYEIYDARLEGGFPAPAIPAPCASAATCRSMIATPPASVAPANGTSVSFQGPGNPGTPVTETPPPAPATAKIESRSEKLSKALKACKKAVRHVKRQKCERAARAKYGPVGKKAVRKK
jgi:hypothetical protein